MDRLTISPLRGLIDFWFALSYNLFIPSGLKKMNLKVNQESMQAMFLIGLKTLFDGYLIETGYSITKLLIISELVFDGYLIKEEL